MNPVWDGPIAIIGAGQLGSAMMEGLVNHGHPGELVRIVTRDPLHAQALARRHGVIDATPAEAMVGATAIVLAVRPGQMLELLDDIAVRVPSGAVVISLAGGPDNHTLVEHLPVGTPIVRAMTTPAIVTQALTALCPAPGCPAEVIGRVRGLFDALGGTIMVDEHRFGLMGELAGHGQAALYYVLDSLIQWAVMQGFSRPEATALVAQVMASASAAVSAGDQSPVELQNRLCTPGGSTVRSMAELDERGVRAALIACIDGGRFRR